MITVRVPGKIILFGDYAVCHGAPGISVGVDKYITMTCDVRGDDKEHFSLIQLRDLFMMALELLEQKYIEPVQMTLESDIPTGKGFGSSSALCVGISVLAFEYAGIKFTNEEALYKLALDLESKYFNSSPSGIDTMTCINGGCIMFRDGKIIESLDPSHLVVSMYDTGQTHRTCTDNIQMSVALVDRAKDLVTKAREHFYDEDVTTLKTLASKYHCILDDLGVSCTSNYEVIYHKNQYAKISGSGNGGIMIVISDNDNEYKADEVLKYAKHGMHIQEDDMPLYLSRLQYRLRKHNAIDDLINNNKSGCASAPANIALIKYWGKTYDRLQSPLNSNISLTLSELRSYTRVHISKENEHKNTFTSPKLESFLERINPYNDTNIVFESANNFPTGCGIASSASGLCALVGAVGELLDVKKILGHDARYWYENWSRLGSGSACRSLYKGFVSWETDNKITQHETKMDLVDIVVVFDPFKKEIASSLGHDSVNTSLFQKFRLPNTVTQTYPRVCLGIKEGRVQDIVDDVEMDSMMIHAIMQTASDKNDGYLNEKSMSFIEKFITFRNNHELNAMFTFDAGPNPHIIIERKHLKRVQEWITKQSGWNSMIINEQSDKGMITGEQKLRHPKQIFKHTIRIVGEEDEKNVIKFESPRQVLQSLRENRTNLVLNSINTTHILEQMAKVIY